MFVFVRIFFAYSSLLRRELSDSKTNTVNCTWMSGRSRQNRWKSLPSRSRRTQSIDEDALLSLNENFHGKYDEDGNLISDGVELDTNAEHNDRSVARSMNRKHHRFTPESYWLVLLFYESSSHVTCMLIDLFFYRSSYSLGMISVYLLSFFRYS